MSRDPTLTLDESNLVIGKDGRVHYTFTASQDNQTVRLASNCLGTAHFNQLMIERGDKATGYVAPVVVEGSGESTGVFKSLEEMLSGLQSINLELTDTKNSNLWSKIKLTTNGMLREYHRDNITTEIIEKADGIATRISEDSDKKLALINDTIDGIRREYQDADRELSASYQAGIEGLKATMASDKLGLQAEIKMSARGLSQKYDDEIRKLSAKITTTSSGTTEAYENKLEGLRAEFTRSNQGMRIELESQISGLRAVQQSTASQISQEIRDRTGAVSRVQQDLDSYQRRLQDAEDNYSSLTHTVRGLQSDVVSPTGKIQSRLTQLAGQIEQRVTRDGVMSIISGAGDSIKLAIQKAGGINAKMSGNEIISAINLNSYGVTIAGKHIALDGNTTVNGTFTTKIAEAIKIRADQIIAGTIDAARIRVINLNASSIVGLDANFIKAKIGYAITDLLEGKVIKARNGAMTIDLQSGQINHYTNESAMRRIDSSTASQFIKMTKSGFISEIGNMQAAMTVIGSNSDGSENHENKTFGGIRIWNGKSSYQSTSFVELVGNRVAIYGNKNRSPWLFDSTTSGYAYLIPQNDRGIKHVIGRADRKIDQIHVGDIYVQGERVAMMLKDLALKIGYIGTGGWANRIG
ncbi:TPA: gp58-like family protein [Streptococcus pyogenes]|uniref:Gp58-like domain-containing protein n=14 Tax=Streptococcus pyogenes TaxID=1314 RepID=A0ABD7UUF1_STRPY|nr:gp58-like family protein [Streptococcus pyogenes]EZM60065.1 phage infection protein [Streptococcus pyogenes ABC020046230]QBX19006.1 hyaluronidase [Streptococcus phage Javan459]QBX20577.1 hyaluronidase [Streptococcus phage Javan525]HEP6153399.1 gp58-like family protein [Streptococcus pyogenes ABC020047615]HEP6175110.1 gp58-like family protein [Streptococcus pyogenes ABC020056755]HEP6184029.1 gp58-like family protein [Streptococcus pyogenes ABC020061794]HEP6185866.1 gp58-like family protein